ncbi:carbohydrate ABC transporter permease [Streptacidiphilus carbonis]|jgi:multiple sugar transport system permease protein|uniref:carbohydrate ABC transporter permease n=1 Tax=Streptacidiphilus carbonis TaxID=105422 RepID=UPI0005A63E91|nr:carbohydrate ABC transporter permease [Streptacidiphilus carbonis]
MTGTAVRRTLLYAALLVGALISVAPYLMTLNASFKTTQGMFSTQAWTPAHPATFSNFASLWSQYDMSGFMVHTLIVSVAITVGQVLFCSLSAYAFARMEFPGRDLLFWAFVATMMVPQIVTLVPLFLIMSHFQLTDTYRALILPYVFGTPYGIFLVRQYFRTIPPDLEAAARIDGAGTWTILWRIILPLSRPILATLATVTFVNSWNNLLWPLMATSSERTTVITVGISALQGQYASQLNIVLTAAAVALLPLIAVFLVFQRHIVRSIALTGLK